MASWSREKWLGARVKPRWPPKKDEEKEKEMTIRWNSTCWASCLKSQKNHVMVVMFPPPPPLHPRALDRWNFSLRDWHNTIVLIMLQSGNGMSQKHNHIYRLPFAPVLNFGELYNDLYAITLSRIIYAFDGCLDLWSQHLVDSCTPPYNVNMMM